MTGSESRQYPTYPFRRLVAERLAGTSPTLPNAILAIAQTLAEWQPTISLRYAGDPPRSIELTEPALASYLQEFQQARAQGIPMIFCLATEGEISQFTLFFDSEPTPTASIDYCWFSLPTWVPSEALQLAQMTKLMASVCQGFGAFHGFIEDEQLLLLYRQMAVDQAHARVPPEFRQFIPEHPTPTGAAGTLPQLLFPRDFDRRQVPDAVWWINYWDRTQVETVGLDRVRSANWSQIIEQPDGALVLVATEEPSNVTNLAHLAQVRQIVETLNLRKLQESHRYKEREQ